MEHLKRPSLDLTRCVVLAAGCAVALGMAPSSAPAQAQQLTPVFADSSTQAGAPGYLGIDIADLDAGKAEALKLKDARGAVITLIDHDAPAGQAGLKVNDVVLQLDNASIENADQLRHLLKSVPAGRKITLGISRNGSVENVTVQLVDRRQMEKKVWTKLGSAPDVPEMGMLSGDSLPSGFHFPSFGSTLKVGALVEPLTAQMAAYLGVESGLMVKEVARKSAAAVAGLRAFDVILKVGADSIATSADWDRALRANQGKPVLVTILRNKKQQDLTLHVDSKHHSGRMLELEPFGPGDAQMLADLQGLHQEISRQIAAQTLAASEAARAQVGVVQQQLSASRFAASPQESAVLHRQAERLSDCLKSFQPDPQRLDRLRRRLEEFRRDIAPDQVRLDPRQMQELQQRMEQFGEQMKEWSAQAQGRFV